VIRRKIIVSRRGKPAPVRLSIDSCAGAPEKPRGMTAEKPENTRDLNTRVFALLDDRLERRQRRRAVPDPASLRAIVVQGAGRIFHTLIARNSFQILINRPQVMIGKVCEVGPWHNLQQVAIERWS
jgi:hypothetical protein